MGVNYVLGFGGVGEADAGYKGGGMGAFDAGSEGFDGVEGCQGIFCGEVVEDGGLAGGEQGGEGGAVGDGFVRGDIDSSLEGALQALRIMRLRPSWMVRCNVVACAVRPRCVSFGGNILPSSRLGPEERAARALRGTGFLTVTSYSFSTCEEGCAMR